MAIYISFCISEVVFIGGVFCVVLRLVALAIRAAVNLVALGSKMVF